MKILCGRCMWILIDVKIGFRLPDKIRYLLNWRNNRRMRQSFKTQQERMGAYTLSPVDNKQET